MNNLKRRSHELLVVLVTWPCPSARKAPKKPRVEEKEAPRAKKKNTYISPELRLKFTQP
jgi:hypothetical protein